MLGLTSTLEAAQRQMDVLPVVSVTIGDVPPESLRLSEVVNDYAGTEGDVSFDACWVPSSGQIARIRCDGSGNVYVQLVTPGTGAAWSSWTQLASGTAYPNGPVAIGAWAGGGIRPRWLSSDGHTMLESYSAGGSSPTWNAASSWDAGIGNLVTGIACDQLESGYLRWFWVVAGGQLFESHWTGSTYSAGLGDGNGYGGTPRVSVGYRPTTAPGGDGNCFVLVTYGSPSVLAVRQFDTGTNIWDSGGLTTLRAATSGYGYGWGRLAEARSYQPRAAITWHETPPSPLPAVARLGLTPTHAAITASLPWLPGGSLPAGITLTNGLKAFCDTASPSRWWFLAANAVWHALADSATGTGQRVSFAGDQVVDFRIDQTRVNHPATVQVTVQNQDGALATAGIAGGAYQALRQWSQLALSVGYHSSAGDETVWQIPCWIESIAFRDDVAKGEAHLTLFCVDAWGILDRIIAGSAITFTNATLDQILRWFWWHVCGDLDASPPASLNGITLASFVVRAGESLGAAVRRLCGIAGVVLRFRTLSSSVDGVGWDSVGQSVVSWATGGSVYSYGPSAGQHPVIQGNLAPLVAPSGTAVEVVGKSTSSVSRDMTLANLLGHELVVRVVDKTLDTQAKTDATASQMVALFAPEGRGGEITTLANVGIELGDQITLNVPTAGVGGEVYTVAGIVTSWSRSHALVQTLQLEGTN